MTRMIGSARVGVATLLASSLIAMATMRAQSAEVQSVITMNDRGTIVVVIEADGPLPIPTPGFADTPPPRMFLDFVGVTPKRRGMVTSPGSGVVRQTRIALYADNVTRVVLDLVKVAEYRIDASERKLGRIRIIFAAQAAAGGPGVTPPIPPAVHPLQPDPALPLPETITSTPTTAKAPSVPASPAPRPSAAAPAMAPPMTAPPPPVPKPSATPPAPTAHTEATTARQRPVYTPPPLAPKPPSREVERYRQRLSGALERLEAQQPIVTLLDAEGAISMEALQAAFEEFTSVRRMLDGIKPSDPMTSAHELLLASCTMGATATRLGLDASRDRNEQMRKNAASAAAGALMFFDRACAELGCGRPSQ